LTVFDASGGARVLAFDAHGVGSFLEEAAFIDNEHALGTAQVLDDVVLEFIADGLGVPEGSIQQMLEAIGIDLSEVLGQLPSVLTLDGAEQALEIVQGELFGFDAPKVGAEASCQVRQKRLAIRDVLQVK
jgi:hypothetical protein